MPTRPDEETAPMMESMPTIYAKDVEPQRQRRCAVCSRLHCVLALASALGMIIAWLLIAALLGAPTPAVPLGPAGSCPSGGSADDPGIEHASSLNGEVIP